ncbi:hypothetical protein [Planomicrobium sp. YIM 101495]|uniref:hypothetical protein n=1 Tax=Planomicrobium sp. YIM 101495 TaxID=2665160 RepID=UPI0012B840F3|nr:hypothetical protein [Planomicrobium sp. YIM 101495]MTD29747.1 hypothetical protein [Planomicrobium sp. YIM 101495]
MRSKVGTALDIFIVVIAPIILIGRVREISENGFSTYPVISIVIVTLALVFTLYNLYNTFKNRSANGNAPRR